MASVEPPSINANVRIERDSLGEVAVPIDAWWGASTQRAIEHFRFAGSTEQMPAELVDAYSIIKQAAAEANHAQGRLDANRRDLIVMACERIRSGQLAEAFPLPVWVAGSGTSLNTNVNEVIANVCCEASGTARGSKTPVHPNDHVNLSQSTNDTFPAAVHIAAVGLLDDSLVTALSALRERITAHRHAWEHVIKVGRTHLQDATPLTVGQEWSGYVTLLAEHSAAIEACRNELCALALGGTAVGTGLNTVEGYPGGVTEHISQITGTRFVPATNFYSVMGSHDALVRLSSALRGLAVFMNKMANDLRFLACGPRGGINELRLPAQEPGSSIMPGKVNPTGIESLTMVCLHVIGSDVAAGLANTSGSLQMNAYKPLLAHTVLRSTRLLADSLTNFTYTVIDGLELNEPVIDDHVQRNLMLVTALAGVIGYDKSAEIAHYAAAHDTTLKEAAQRLGLVDAAAFDEWVDPRRMTGPSPAPD